MQVQSRLAALYPEFAVIRMPSGAIQQQPEPGQQSPSASQQSSPARSSQAASEAPTAKRSCSSSCSSAAADAGLRSDSQQHVSSAKRRRSGSPAAGQACLHSDEAALQPQRARKSGPSAVDGSAMAAHAAAQGNRAEAAGSDNLHADGTQVKLHVLCCDA